MRVLVVADIHGNYPALEAVLAEPHDLLICIGDLVGYGPHPALCVRRILDEAHVVLRGNHDHALATGAEIGGPPSLQWLADAAAEIGERQLSRAEQEELAGLPLRSSQLLDGCPYYLVHATPTDPLHRHLEPTADGWEREVREIGPEVLLVGHSHLQFRHHVTGRTIISPGSVGQPRHGDPRAAYMIIEDGRFTFCRADYDIERTVEALQRCAIEPAAEAALIQLLRTGRPSLYLARSRPTNPGYNLNPAVHAPTALQS